jgi:hypothetical protein
MRDDRVFPETRLPEAVIVPFLVIPSRDFSATYQGGSQRPH